MSVCPSIDIVLHPNEIALCHVFSVLLSGTWMARDNDHISYMDTGDQFEWSEGSIDTLDAVLGKLALSVVELQPAGLVLTWPSPLTGGMFSVFPKTQTLAIWPTINRRTLSSSPRWTDYTWYLEHVVPLLEDSGFLIERIDSQDY